MIRYCAICEGCTSTLMPRIECTWDVDVGKNPERRHHVSVARWSDEMVIQALVSSERTGHYSKLNTFRAQSGIM